MLTGKMVRVRYARDRVQPYYLDTRDENWRMVAEQLLELFRDMAGRTRGELEEMIEETFGDDETMVHQGLAKLLEDRCDFEVSAAHSPAEVRATVFKLATLARTAPETGQEFDRESVLTRAAELLGVSVEAVNASLFADLKSEQRVIAFKDMTGEQLLERYNVALAQAILLRATRVDVTLIGEPPTRYRQLLRQIKFHRLICEVEHVAHNSHTFHLDGPLSLFTSTQKYGMQLALFLPAVLLCRNYELNAEVRWGTQKKVKRFQITACTRRRSWLCSWLRFASGSETGS
jgi:predicted nuclease of restriction endonuclease-like RecB superfamily